MDLVQQLRNEDVVRFGSKELPADWRSLPEYLKRKAFKEKGWSRRDYKKYIGALPRWMQRKGNTKSKD